MSSDIRILSYDATTVSDFLLHTGILTSMTANECKLLLAVMCHASCKEETALQELSLETGLSEQKIKQVFRQWIRIGFLKEFSGDSPEYCLSVPTETDPASFNVSEKDVRKQYAALCHVIFSDPEQEKEALSKYHVWIQRLGLSLDIIRKVFEYVNTDWVYGPDFHALDKLIVRIAQENDISGSRVDALIEHDRKIRFGAYELLDSLGFSRYPSDDEMEMYRIWVEDWNLTRDEIVSARRETTKIAEPSMKYIHGVLKKTMERRSAWKDASIDFLHAEEFMRNLSYMLNARMDLSKDHVYENMIQTYEQMISLYPEDIVLLAADECAKRSGTLEDIIQMLASWKQRGLDDRESIQKFIHDFDMSSVILNELAARWGREALIGKNCREKALVWVMEYGFAREMILGCADIVGQARNPFVSLDHLLRKCHNIGIDSPEGARKIKKAKNETARS